MSFPGTPRPNNWKPRGKTQTLPIANVKPQRNDEQMAIQSVQSAALRHGLQRISCKIPTVAIPASLKYIENPNGLDSACQEKKGQTKPKSKRVFPCKKEITSRFPKCSQFLTSRQFWRLTYSSILFEMQIHSVQSATVGFRATLWELVSILRMTKFNRVSRINKEHPKKGNIFAWLLIVDG